MTAIAASEIETATHAFMKGLIQRNPGEPEFHQAVEEVIESLMPFVFQHPEYRKAKILERITEPDRTITFRVCWEDDSREIQVNRAWRVQFNNSIGPYKGGMRFHPTVNQGVLKFLGFEQVFKNSLTTLPMGGAKGGSDFDPKGKSDGEVQRFCHALMTELYRHIGEYTDVPAGDIGVGAREISAMFGQYKRIVNRFTGAITGKSLAFGGSLVRIEATGYGCVYFAENMLKHRGDSVAGKTACVSGSGNVALYAIEKCIQMGAKVVTVSDSDGFVHDPSGIDADKLAFLKDLKEVRRGRVSEYADRFGCEFYPDERPWRVPCQMALPCATQNEIERADAEMLLRNGVQVVSEGANMPSDRAATQAFLNARILYAPGKAANAGGVAVSGLEQSQNAQRLSWTREEVDDKLRRIMERIHEQCVTWGQEDDGWVDYVKGANLGGFVKVAAAMLAYGVM
jgi:glutamate dehydrogenase (NADP+)